MAWLEIQVWPANSASSSAPSSEPMSSTKKMPMGESTKAIRSMLLTTGSPERSTSQLAMKVNSGAMMAKPSTCMTR